MTSRPCETTTVVYYDFCGENHIRSMFEIESASIANGAGTISDMYLSSERAGVFGVTDSIAAIKSGERRE
ncbi:hypothetical protein BHYA_0033g00110 [Botrytis hyacinthi]|uniref:Uncharacterized protein n=1 Tax=Botrytis hyacinthi TaxID=278943 RepID=A0A4Z1GW55_9HELO|nr:hypothetical protein BHYA_0033g00110 [Botrytis hyacinthi]